MDEENKKKLLEAYLAIQDLGIQGQHFLRQALGLAPLSHVRGQFLLDLLEAPRHGVRVLRT